MSIFSSIAAAEHTFVSWAEKELAKFEAEAPKLETLAENGFKYATVALNIVKSQIPAGNAALATISQVQQDLTVASAVVYDAGAHPTVGTILQDVAGNLGGILSASQVTNAGTVSTITKVVGTISALAAAFLQSAPAV